MDNKQDKGFTLVELLIVIVILGILATVTVFAVRGITDRGQDNACDVEGRTLSTAIEAYYADNQSDPSGIADLSPAYLKEAPAAANWTFYGAGDTVPANDGPDGEAGTADDVAARTTTTAEYVGTGKCTGF